MIPKDHPHWKRMRFKENKVWMAVDADHRPLLEKGKVLIKYQLDQPHEYWVLPSKVTQLDSADGNPPAPPRPSPAGFSSQIAAASDEPPPPQACENAVCIYTDGACSGNPGPAGIGVVLRFKEQSKEIARYIGEATNNIAELEAIKAGLTAVKNRDRPVLLFTDSSYAFGLLTKGWKAKSNTALVKELRELCAAFKQLRIVKVKGHAGHPDNERADRLAVRAIQEGSAGGIAPLTGRENKNPSAC